MITLSTSSQDKNLLESLKMTKQEILERIQNVLYQGVDTESQDLDLLRHDLENDIIEEDKKWDHKRRIV